MCHVKTRVAVAVVYGTPLVILYLTAAVHCITGDCDYQFLSSDGHRNGTFQTPNYPEPYEKEKQCSYTFIAEPGQRVQIRFNHFDVKGTPPECNHDYVDVYTQIQKEKQDLLEVPLHGRYCGTTDGRVPELLISMNHIFLILFNSDRKNELSGFQGDYEFIDASMYVVGTPATSNVCGQSINGDVLSTGFIYSPTYPGMYPDNIFCYYKLKGHKGQRIRLTVVDMDLFDDDRPHCPFDYIKVYDGYTKQDTVIDTYCGFRKNFSIYSTGPDMHIEFVTKSGRVEPTRATYIPFFNVNTPVSKRSGFKAEFEISDRFVNLDFISGDHVRGSECDQRVLSKRETNGTITSPGYPDRYPLNVTCLYFIDGLDNPHDLEKTRLHFVSFDIPSTAGNTCKNGNLSVFLRKDGINGKPDQVLCGSSVPNDLVTMDSPRLALIFNSSHGSHSGNGFKAHYQFITDYAIPGTPATDSTRCHFIYHSSSHKTGQFNTPRNPSNYPQDTDCVYEFKGMKQEKIRITFDTFHLEPVKDNCTADYVDIFIIKYDLDETRQEIRIGRYCGQFTPGPIMTDDDVNEVQVYFHSDHKKVYPGFRATYEFIEKVPTSQRCLKNITSGVHGIIKYPGERHKYEADSTCEWFIHSRSQQILLHFEEFSIEGNMAGDGGCSAAVLKVYITNLYKPDHEFCGKETKYIPELISVNRFIKLKFMSAKRITGAKGFQIAWNEVSPTLNVPVNCEAFLCKKSSYCIAENLRCNGHPNCGMDDDSDEGEECGECEGLVVNEHQGH